MRVTAHRSACKPALTIFILLFLFLTPYSFANTSSSVPDEAQNRAEEVIDSNETITDDENIVVESTPQEIEAGECTTMRKVDFHRYHSLSTRP